MTVTIEVPASVPAQLRKPEGDAGGAEALATTIYAAAGRYEEFADRSRELQELGVARVSTGPFTQRVALTALQDAAAAVVAGGTLPVTTRALN